MLSDCGRETDKKTIWKEHLISCVRVEHKAARSHFFAAVTLTLNSNVT